MLEQKGAWGVGTYVFTCECTECKYKTQWESCTSSHAVAINTANRKGFIRTRFTANKAEDVDYCLEGTCHECSEDDE